jgi:hypothetical protein
MFDQNWAQERAQRPRLDQRYMNHRRFAREIDPKAPIKLSYKIWRCVQVSTPWLQRPIQDPIQAPGQGPGAPGPGPGAERPGPAAEVLILLPFLVLPADPHISR